MSSLIAAVASSGTGAQALFVSAFGLCGVFATLFVFWLLIWLGDKLGPGKPASGRRAGGRRGA